MGAGIENHQRIHFKAQVDVIAGFTIACCEMQITGVVGGYFAEPIKIRC